MTALSDSVDIRNTLVLTRNLNKPGGREILGSLTTANDQSEGIFPWSNW